MNSPARKRTNPITRRSAIGGSLAAVGAVAATSLPAMAEDAAVSRFRRNSVHTLPEDHWENFVGEDFRVVDYSFDSHDDKSPRTTLQLVEASPVRTKKADLHRPNSLRKSAISLLFRGPEDVLLSDASYKLWHPRLGEIDLLMSQTKTKSVEGNHVYEAIINN